jgi:hypothetical protein
LVKEHSHSVNAAAAGLTALPATAKPFAATKAMHRLLKHEDTPLHALIEPVHEAIRGALAGSDAAVALAVHDWCLFSFTTHTGKRRVEWQDPTLSLQEIVQQLSSQFRDAPSARPIVVATANGPGRVQLCETTVVLHRPAKTMIAGTTCSGLRVTPRRS